MESLIFVVFLFLIVWLVFVLPARRRSKAHQAMQDSVVVGDEIITAGGLHGFVRESGDEEVQLEIAPNVVVRLDRRAIAAVARDVSEEGSGDAAEDETPADEADSEPAPSSEPESESEGGLVEARDPADRGS